MKLKKENWNSLFLVNVITITSDVLLIIPTCYLYLVKSHNKALNSGAVIEIMDHSIITLYLGLPEPCTICQIGLRIQKIHITPVVSISNKFHIFFYLLFKTIFIVCGWLASVMNGFTESTCLCCYISQLLPVDNPWLQLTTTQIMQFALAGLLIWTMS